MKRLTHISPALGILLAVIFVNVSCVNKEYDLNNINSEVTIGGDLIALPLGSTEELKLKDILSSEEIEGLESIDGNYHFRMGENFDFSDQIPDLAEKLKLKDISVAKDFLVDLGIENADALKVDGMSFDYEFKISEDEVDVDIEIPQMSENLQMTFDFNEYKDILSDISFNLEPVDFHSASLYSLPSVTLPPGLDESYEFEITVDESPAIDLSQEVSVTTDLPENVSKIQDVKMGSNSRVSITLEIVNSFLTDGSIIPDLELDLSGLLKLKNITGQLNVSEDFTLTKANGYKSQKEYYIEAINIGQEDWTADGGLDMSRTIKLSGNTSLVNAKSTIGKINSLTEGMSLKVGVQFIDLSVESASFEIDPIEVTREVESFININDIVLPEGVNQISNIRFRDDSKVELLLNRYGTGMTGLDVSLEDLVITFPEELVVSGAEDNKFTHSSHNLANGQLRKEISISGFNPPAPSNGEINYEGKIKITSTLKASGRINTSDLSDNNEGFGLQAGVTTSLYVEEFDMEIDEMSQELDIEPEVISFDLPDGLEGSGTFNVTPKGEPALSISFNIPQTEIQMTPGGEGIKVSLPEFIKFKDVDQSLEFDYDKNVFTIKNSIPSLISLPIDFLQITPEKNEETGKYSVSGEVRIEGSVAIPPGTISSNDLVELSTAIISLSAVIPDIEVQEISMESLSVEISESFDFIILKAGDIPAEVVAVSNIDLGDAKTALEINVTDLPDLGTDIILDVEVIMPEIVILDKTSANVEGNKIKLSGKLKDGKFTAPAIKITGIDLSGHDFSSKEDLKGEISVTGTISADSPKVDVSTVDKEEISCKVNAGITGIDIKRIEGNIDYSLEGIEEEIELNLGLEDGMSMNLDFDNPHIKLDVSTNMGIPVSGSLVIIPVYDGKEDEGKKLTASITLPYSDNHAETKTGKYWIGTEDKGRPSDYTYIKADIKSLIKNLPDKLKIRFDAGTDKSKMSIVEPSADYKLNLAYEFGIPFAFGEDFKIELCDTLAEMSDILPVLLESGDLTIAGTVTNSLPLQFDIEIEVLDSKGKVLQLENAPEQRIESCASDGSASTSNLELKLSKADGTDMRDATSLKVTFIATSASAAGVPVNEDDFIQATLSAMVTDGITLDFREINNGDE